MQSGPVFRISVPGQLLLEWVDWLLSFSIGAEGAAARARECE